MEKELTYICSKCKTEKPISEFGKANNRKRGHRSQCKTCLKEYDNLNKEKIAARKKKYRELHKEEFSVKRKKYYSNNKDKTKAYELKNADKLKAQKKLYRENNKEIIKIKQKEYQLDNLDKFRNGNKKHYKKNKKSIHVKNNEWRKDKIKADPLYKLKVRTRTLVYNAFRNKTFRKGTKTTNILGCSFETFKSHLEQQFEYWMNWDNYGKYNGELNYGWDFDHIIPISSATTKDEVFKLNHYTNFQPLCSHVNRDIKKDKLNYKAA